MFKILTIGIFVALIFIILKVKIIQISKNKAFSKIRHIHEMEYLKPLDYVVEYYLMV